MPGMREAQCWYALQVRPRHEKITAWALRNKGFEDFLPLYTAVRRWSDRMKEVEEPLFTRYVFCRFGLEDKLAILTTPGVNSIVGIGKNPMPVEPNEMSALQAIVRSGAPAVPWPFLRVGETVRIDAGPLSGLEGILLDFRNQRRLIVSVTLLQRAVAVEVKRLWVTPMGVRGRPPAIARVLSVATEVRSA